tara:strand:- start:7745 stop:7990 length:246 start_codon:yes stop_codon:yes gene_type:complete
MGNKTTKEIKKGSLVIFSQPNDLETKRYQEMLEVFSDLFGDFAVVISDVYYDESDDKYVVDLWFPKNIVFYLIPIDKLECL